MDDPMNIENDNTQSSQPGPRGRGSGGGRGRGRGSRGRRTPTTAPGAGSWAGDNISAEHWFKFPATTRRRTESDRNFQF